MSNDINKDIDDMVAHVARGGAMDMDQVMGVMDRAQAQRTEPGFTDSQTAAKKTQVVNNDMMMAAWRRARRSIIEYDSVAFIGIEGEDALPENYHEHMKYINEILPGKVADAQVFCCTHDMMDAFHGNDMVSIHQSVNDMRSAEVFKLPHDPCIFLTSYTNTKAVLALICYEAENEEGDLSLFTHATVINKEMTKHHRCSFMPGYASVNLKQRGDMPVYYGIVEKDLLIKHSSRFTKLYGHQDVLPYWKEAIGQTGHIFCTFMVMLGTRGIGIKNRSLLGDGTTKLRRRDVAEYSYHELTIPGFSDGGTGTGHTIEERKRVRLHIRRGHTRLLDGKGPKRRVTWVKPCLVGYEEEGAVSKNYAMATLEESRA